MALPDKRLFPLNRFFKGLPKKACEACPFIKITCRKHTKKAFMPAFTQTNLYMIAKGEGYYPHTLVG